MTVELLLVLSERIELTKALWDHVALQQAWNHRCRSQRETGSDPGKALVPINLYPTPTYLTGIDHCLLDQVDFNVPLDSDKKITNNQRIVGALPTIKHAVENGAKAVILMSHLGRPDGKRNEKYSLKPVVSESEKLLGKSVIFANDCVGSEVEQTVNKAEGGQVILLENLRFHAEEEGSSKDSEGNKVKADKGEVEKFRKGLTALGDIYISGLRRLHRYSS